MGVQVSLTANPKFEQIQKLAKQIEDETLADFSEFWDLLKPFVSNAIRERFESENQGKWAPLSPRYRAWKEKNYPGRPILQLTRQLYNAATTQGSPGNVCEKEKNSFTWGVDVQTIPHAAYVQSGGRSPSRVWCELSKESEADINLNFGYWLRKRLDEKCRGIK
jgi:hypothetical protein